MRAIAWAAALAAAAAGLQSPVIAGGLSKDFVYLADFAPEIRQDMRYAGSRNFTGGAVPGYKAAECVLSREAAQALRAVHAALSARGLGLLALDCYRPAKAVRHFVSWAEGGGASDPDHHPRLERSALLAEGYIARRSGHSTGFSVDVTLTDSRGVERDMGTPFDFFDPLAATSSGGIPARVAERRRILVEAMALAGFVNYRREWWHFSLGRRPAEARSHDFDILPRGG